MTEVFNFDIEEFNFDEPCLLPANISEIALVQGGSDGWFIRSAFTTFTTYTTNSRSSVPATVDLSINKYVDENGSQSTHARRIVLTKAT